MAYIESEETKPKDLTVKKGAGVLALNRAEQISLFEILAERLTVAEITDALARVRLQRECLEIIRTLREKY